MPLLLVFLTKIDLFDTSLNGNSSKPSPLFNISSRTSKNIIHSGWKSFPQKPFLSSSTFFSFFSCPFPSIHFFLSIIHHRFSQTCFLFFLKPIGDRTLFYICNALMKYTNSINFEWILKTINHESPGQKYLQVSTSVSNALSNLQWRTYFLFFFSSSFKLFLPIP